MIIKKLTLHSSSIENQASFFSEVLGLEVFTHDRLLSVTIGHTVLEFQQSQIQGKYHYCFLIPCNQLEEAKHWLSDRLDLIPVNEKGFIAHFDTWNASSIYFYDGNNNIAELIVRYDLQNESDELFGIHSFLSVNEIGTPTSDIRALNTQLIQQIGSQYWKGDLDRFATNGDQHGLFLLPNYNIKKMWYPTEMKVLPLPYSAIIIQDDVVYKVQYHNENMKITRAN